MICTDAMVLAYLLLHHPEHSPEVRSAAETEPEWCAPPLWRSELRSVLLKYVRAENVDISGGELSLEGAIERMSTAEELLAGRTFDVSSETVLRLSADSGLSSYDAEYVALAKELDVPLLTYDRAILQAFPRIAARPGEDR